MTNDSGAASEVAERIRTALDTADLEAFTQLLDPDVHWGAPDDDAPSCQSRTQVLAWYQRGRDDGVRADVTEVVASGDRLVGLRVRGNPAAASGAVERWQVMALSGRRVVGI